jgi:hypothetical protein
LKKLHSELSAFHAFNNATKIDFIASVDQMLTVYENAFWTSKQRDGHSIHEISYRACYKPQLPAFFIDRFCRPNDIVYDPFMGRGTTLIEAQLHGCKTIGNDANPIARILTAPRLNPPAMDQLEQRLSTIELKYSDTIDPDLLVFFAPQTLKELYAWRVYFKSRQQCGEFDNVDAWLQMVACNRLTGHSNGFFSVYTLPPNQATSITAQRRINSKRNLSPEYRDTKLLILKKSKQLLRHKLPRNYHRSDSQLICSSADHTPQIASESVKLVVTSPPFLDVVDYLGDNWLRMWFCDVHPDRSQIWQLRSLSDWSMRMRQTLIELHRILRPDGWIAFEVGEIKKNALKLEHEVVKAGLSAGLIPECIMINSQNFTKTANCWGISNNAKGTNSNRIVMFKKS